MGMLRLAIRQALSLPRRVVVSPSKPLPLINTKTFNNQVAIISRMSSWSTVPSGPKDQRMIWVDCEMTGLDITKDKLIEIAMVVTDKDLNILAQGPNLVIHQPKDVMDNMNEWCINQHGLSGLTQRVLDSKIDEEEAERQIMNLSRPGRRLASAPWQAIRSARTRSSSRGSCPSSTPTSITGSLMSP